MANFYIKWKGEISGPFSNSEILEMLNTGKIGLLHEIREENSESWQFLKDFDISKAENAPQKKSDADMMYAAFFLGGVYKRVEPSLGGKVAAFGIKIYNMQSRALYGKPAE